MRICTKCGAQFPDDELICPVCGQEVQLVPDYVTIESHMQEDELRRQEEEKKRREEQERQAQIEARKKQIHRNVILTTALFIVAVGAVILFAVFAKINKQSRSFDYQFEHARTEYQEGAYEKADKFITQALTLKPDDAEARFLNAQIKVGMKKDDQAIEILEKLVGDQPEMIKAYDLLIQLYQAKGENAKIEQLLKNCTNTEILNKYADYLAGLPVISPGEGEFSSEIEITITATGKGTIYYTKDGSDPTENSEIYKESFKLGEGEYTVKAVLITENGTKSDIASASYKIVLETPPTPEISPKSGTYTQYVDKEGKAIDEEDFEDYGIKKTATSSNQSEGSKKTKKDPDEITIKVPEGYTCYYSFDTKPTENGRKYTEPVKMKEGEHIFYAVLQSKEGKFGKIASATYVFTKVKVTPTPTPTPYPTTTPAGTYDPSEAYEPDTYNTPTPTPTEEPTPEPTEEPTPEPTPTTDASGENITGAAGD